MKKKISIMSFITIFMLAFAFAGISAQAQAKIRLNHKTLYMAKGDKETLKILGTKKKVTWKSSKKSIVTVSKKGKLTAKKTGKATITAKAGGKKYKCKVTVEKKAVNRARKLRDYVLKHGKYDKAKKIYNLEKEYIDENYSIKISRISASKSNKTLIFTFINKPESPRSTSTTALTIDLISGKTSVKKGKVESNYWYPDDYADEDTLADITTAFDGKGAALTVTSFAWDEPDEESGGSIRKTESDPNVMKDYVPSVQNRLNNGFALWNKYMSGKKELKKYKITMQSIGFSKWTK